MDFKIIWAESVIADIKDIYEYISRDNPAASEKTGRGILSHVRILETFPLIREAPAALSGKLFAVIIEFFTK